MRDSTTITSAPLRSDALSVLLVEDNPGDARLVRAYLAEDPQQVRRLEVVSTLAMARERLGRERHDVVLLDLSLPDSQGLATVRGVLDAASETAVIVLTGLADEEIGTQAVRAGCQDYLVKGRGEGEVLRRALRYGVERKAAERALVASEERSRRLIETAPDAMLVLTAGVIRFANPAARRMLDGAEALDGRELAAHVEAEDVTRFRQALEQAGSEQTCEFRLRTAEGRCLTVEMTAVPLDHRGEAAVQVMLHDITARREAERMRHLAATVFENSDEAMMVSDHLNRIVMINDAFTRMTGYEAAEVIGKNPRILASGRHDKAFYEAMWQALIDAGHWRGEIWDRRKNGEVYVQTMVISVLREEAGRISHFVSVGSDITDRAREDEKIRQRANHDALTGLPNRSLFEDRLELAIAHAERAHSGLAVLFVDLDAFKPINDTHGHIVGDRILQEVATRLRESIRDSDTVARLGGDEFVVILPQARDETETAGVTEKILAAMAMPFTHAGHTLNLGASIGTAFYPQHGRDAETLIVRADEAMYQAKRSGKGTARVYGAAAAA